MKGDGRKEMEGRKEGAEEGRKEEKKQESKQKKRNRPSMHTAAQHSTAQHVGRGMNDSYGIHTSYDKAIYGMHALLYNLTFASHVLRGALRGLVKCEMGMDR